VWLFQTDEGRLCQVAEVEEGLGNFHFHDASDMSKQWDLHSGNLTWLAGKSTI